MKKSKISVGIVGLGFVGEAIYKSFKKHKIKLRIYDKYKKIGNIQKCLNSDMIFLCLPTNYDTEQKKFDVSEILEVCHLLSTKRYGGLVVLKSTVEPETTCYLSEKYSNLNFVYNPEFLSARTSYKDFHKQKHIVLGKNLNCNKNKLLLLVNLYKKFYPKAKISICSCTEAESVKLFCNCFYAIKIQFFTELFLLCEINNIDFNKIKKIMLKNNWINPMHTNVPGIDGQISYGGLCFPKDTNALCSYMDRKNSPNEVLKSVVNERNKMRNK